MDPEDQAPNALAALFQSQPAIRQLVLLFGLAASIAIGIGAAMWLRDPGYTTLYSNVSDAEAAEIVNTLTSSGIDYRLDNRTGAILVPPETVHEARLSLASAGLPRGGGFGLEMIQEESGITSSQFMENARYHHALETELGRTISNVGPVQSARVHLALPRNTVFLRDRQAPSASVFVHLFPGRALERSQVAAIVYLVAGSIPELESSRVTVVDQNGKLLSDSDGTSDIVQSERQFDYVQRLENSYVDRIMALISPVVGPEHVRATVTADVDFTVQEESSELYDPNGGVVRSEQVQENRNVGTGASVGGVPGALSNQPPQVGPAAAAAAGEEPAAQTDAPTSESVRETRNYELNKTLSVTRRPSGTVTRLAVAVVVDDAELPEAVEAAEDGADAGTSARAETLAQVEQLARQAVGFDAARGDTISVTSTAFYEAPPPAAFEEPSFLSSAGFRSVVMQVLSAAVLLVVGWGIVRPIVRMLTAPAPAPSAAFGGAAMLSADGGGPPPVTQLSYTDKVSAARQLVGHDAERVADIVKGWVRADG